MRLESALSEKKGPQKPREMAGAEEILEKRHTRRTEQDESQKTAEESCICAQWGGIFFSFSLVFILSYFAPKLIMTVEHKGEV